MNLKGKKWLIGCSILEIIMGVSSIAMILWILSQDPGNYTFYGTDATNLVKEALWTLMLIYVTSGFQILAGIIGLIGANKPKMAKLCSNIGLILILIHIFNFTHGHGNLDTTTIIVYAILSIVPSMYYYGATLNKKALDETK